MRRGLSVCYIGKDKYFSFFSSRKFGNSEIKDQQPLHIQLLNGGTAALSLSGETEAPPARRRLWGTLWSLTEPLQDKGREEQVIEFHLCQESTT